MMTVTMVYRHTYLFGVYGWEVMGHGVDGVQASDFQGASGLHIPWPVNQGNSCISQYMALKDAYIARVGACTPDG